jgi:protein-S-isoprenylcysteine O-methyltransferase Ste14
MDPVTLIAGTLIILVFSWFYSVKHGRFHGIPRFFSFESIFVLVLMNLKIWFHDPLALLQVISWILLILSAYFGITGFVLLMRVGKPDTNFENTTVLVQSGLYRYIRHPLYSSLLFLGTGIMLKNPGILQVVLGLVNLASLFITARIEEKEMIRKFEDKYSEYMQRTKMFIPYVL